MGSDNPTAAILGLNEAGQRLLRAALATGCLQIKAVADPDSQRAAKAAAEARCEAFSDYRQLVVQNQLDCLLVAAETHTCDEQIKVALRRKFHILKTAPLARTFDESLAYVQMAESEGVRLAVANPARFRGSFRAAHALLARCRLEHPFLITAFCRLDAADQPPWRADPGLAGGGVLLHDGYPLLDQVLWSFSLPEQVYALKTNQAPDKQQRLYRTEDTALVSLRFTETLMGSLVAMRHNEAGPVRATIEIHAQDAYLIVAPDRLELRTPDGRNDLNWRYEEDEQVAFERLLENFVRTLRSPAEYPLASSGAENLRNMAVLESAYLSAKTGFPEQPARILQLAGNSARTVTSV
ncbi:MAG: Gfo/Idh/MocA family oxidoreductase [Planctomycetes bacterium]|jgi:predicted dehydrogenase|nr:Gfo/Idh/MocA family oxidoreductase [Planctomycetota bacterium]